MKSLWLNAAIYWLAIVAIAGAQQCSQSPDAYHVKLRWEQIP